MKYLFKHHSYDIHHWMLLKLESHKLVRQRQLCLALFIILILNCLAIFGLFNGKYPWIFITLTIMFTLIAAIISIDLICDYLKKHGCCSNEIKVSRVFNAHNSEEIY